MTSEARYLDADEPQGDWRVVLPRVNDVEYEVDHRGSHFFITLRDEKRPNSELLVAPVVDPTQTTVTPRQALKFRTVNKPKPWSLTLRRKGHAITACH